MRFMRGIRMLVMGAVLSASAVACSADEPEVARPLASVIGVQPDTSYHVGRDGVLRVLAIGNSFSQDAVEEHLMPIFNDRGVDVRLANVHLGGCSLERHYTNAVRETADYTLWECASGSESTVREGVTLDSILRAHPWDIVTIQQVSTQSGQYDACEPWAQGLIAYVRMRIPVEGRVLWHQTWAYDADSQHEGFANYSNNQHVMFTAIEGVTARVLSRMDIDGVIPTGTAIQLARNMFPDEPFTRDGYHLNSRSGRYTASCTWYEALTGHDARDIMYAPSSVADKAVGLRQAAHQACERYGVEDPASKR